MVVQEAQHFQVIPDQLVSLTFTTGPIERLIDRGDAEATKYLQATPYQASQASPPPLTDGSAPPERSGAAPAHCSAASAAEPGDEWFDWLEAQGLALWAPPQHRRASALAVVRALILEPPAAVTWPTLYGRAAARGRLDLAEIFRLPEGPGDT